MKDALGFGFGKDPLLEELQRTQHPMLRNLAAVRLYGDARDLATSLHQRSYRGRIGVECFRALWDIVDDLHDALHELGLELPQFFIDSHDGVTSQQDATIGYAMMLLDHVKPDVIRLKEPRNSQNNVL